VRRLALLAVVIGGLAALASVVVARRIAAPLEGLTESADRIGGGDLTTPHRNRGLGGDRPPRGVDGRDCGAAYGD
jgi:nitrogen fixation/metabolism regulation signal transduction histidine kinase